MCAQLSFYWEGLRSPYSGGNFFYWSYCVSNYPDGNLLLYLLYLLYLLCLLFLCFCVLEYSRKFCCLLGAGFKHYLFSCLYWKGLRSPFVRLCCRGSPPPVLLFILAGPENNNCPLFDFAVEVRRPLFSCFFWQGQRTMITLSTLL